MFDSGGSSGQLRDELGVLPPGDVLKCALALARNEREARRVLLARLPTLEHARLARPHRRQPAAVDDGALQRRLPRRRRRAARAARLPRARLAGQRRAGELCAEYGDGPTTRGEVEVDAGQTAGHAIVAALARAGGRRSIRRSREAIREFDAAIIGPGSFYTSLMPIFLVQRRARGDAQVQGPGDPRANLLTGGAACGSFTAGEAVRRMGESIGRPVDVAIVNTAAVRGRRSARYHAEHKTSARARRRARVLRGRDRRVLVRRHRAARSPPAGAGGMGGALAAAFLT